MKPSTDAQYWREYDGLQNAKHELLRKYLGGWLPILTSWSGRVTYVDCHAGRGRHADGHAGSPVLALKLLLEHTARERILAKAQVNYLFFEADKSNCAALREEIRALGALPPSIRISIHEQDYETELRGLLTGLRQRGQRLAPTFAFVDPFGFLIPMSLLNDLLAYDRCELMINFMYRYILLAMPHANQAANLDLVFGSSGWRQFASIEDPQERSRAVIDFYTSQLNARYVTSMLMHSDNGALKYVLFHACNDRKGRNLMKSALWSITPDGSFSAHERRNPSQPVLIQPDADLRPLQHRLLSAFGGKTVRLKSIYTWLVDELFLEKHLHYVLNAWRKAGKITVSGFEGTFSFKKNPLIAFPTSVE